MPSSIHDRDRPSSAFWWNLPSAGEHRHHLVIASAGDVLVFASDRGGNLHRFGFVGAHKRDGLEPAFEEVAQIVGLAGDILIGRINDVNDEIRHLREAHQDTGLPFLFQIERIADIHDDAVDVATLERRDLPRHPAHRLDFDAVRTPALTAGRFADQKVSQRAGGGNADFLALEVGDRLWSVGTDDDGEEATAVQPWRRSP